MTIRVSQINAGIDVARVQFSDEHVAIFVLCASSRSSLVPLERMWVSLNLRVVAMFNSPGQRPVTQQPFGLIKLDQGYEVSQITRYWRLAFGYVGAAAEQLPAAWQIIKTAKQDIQALEAGRWPAPR